MSTKILGQDIQTQKYTTGGGTTAYTATVPNLTALYDGFAITVKMNATNTGSSTLNVNWLGAKTLKKPWVTNMAANDLLINSVYTFVYDLSQDFFFISNIDTANNIGDFNTQYDVIWYPSGAVTVYNAAGISNTSGSGTIGNILLFDVSSDAYIYSNIAGKPNTANIFLQWDDIDVIEIEFQASFISPWAWRYFSVWLADTSATTWWTDITSLQRRVFLQAGNNTATTVFVRTADGTTTSASSAITATYTNRNTYKMTFNKGTNVLTYLNGTLVDTKTTNLPTGTNDVSIGVGLDSWFAEGMYLSPITIRIKYA